MPVIVVQVDDSTDLQTHPLKEDEIVDIAPMLSEEWLASGKPCDQVTVALVDKDGNVIDTTVDDEPEHYGNYIAEVETNGRVNFSGSTDKEDTKNRIGQLFGGASSHVVFSNLNRIDKFDAHGKVILVHDSEGHNHIGRLNGKDGARITFKI